MDRENYIKMLVNDLNWDLPLSIQKNAISSLCEIENEYLHLIFDKTQKSSWENSVEIIKRIGFPKNISLLPQLIWLLKDINWPGSLKGVEILSSLEKTIVVPLIEAGILQADAEKDFMWLGGLNYLIKVANYTIDDFANIKLFKMLEKADF